MANLTESERNGGGGSRRTMNARTGGRSERVVRDVIHAAIAELAKVGYGRLRVEDVAERAGVNKTTVYRRWPTKAALVGAALRAAAEVGTPPPDLGSLRKDLVELIHRTLAFLRTEEGRGLTRLMVLEGSDPEVERIVRDLRDEKMAQRLAVCARAERRGELPPGVDHALLVEAIFSPIFNRELRFGQTVDARTIERMVDLVLEGAVHGGGRR